MKKTIAIVICILFVGLTVKAGNDLFEKREFVYKSDTLRYRVLIPENNNDKTKYPIFIFFHDNIECGNDNESQLAQGAALFTNSPNRLTYPVIVIFPQYPANFSWVKYKETGKNTFDFPQRKFPEKYLLISKK